MLPRRTTSTCISWPVFQFLSCNGTKCSSSTTTNKPVDAHICTDGYQVVV